MTLSMRTEIEVRDPRTSVAGPFQRLGFLVLTKRSATCGKENAEELELVAARHAQFNCSSISRAASLHSLLHKLDKTNDGQEFRYRLQIWFGNEQK